MRKKSRFLHDYEALSKWQKTYENGKMSEKSNELEGRINTLSKVRPVNEISGENFMCGLPKRIQQIFTDIKWIRCIKEYWNKIKMCSIITKIIRYIVIGVLCAVVELCESLSLFVYILFSHFCSSVQFYFFHHSNQLVFPFLCRP